MRRTKSGSFPFLPCIFLGLTDVFPVRTSPHLDGAIAASKLELNQLVEHQRSISEGQDARCV